MIRILAFAGSARRESFNKKLVVAAADQARALGAEVTLIDLADFPMPLYDGDLEDAEGVPENASRVRDLMLEHDGLLVACPEYNGSITPLLKNTIDWASRADGDVPGGAAFRGQAAALISASPGSLGGMRGLVHVRAILSGIGVLVVPGDLAVGAAHSAFAPDGSLADERLAGRLDAELGALVKMASALRLDAP